MRKMLKLLGFIMCFVFISASTVLAKDCCEGNFDNDQDVDGTDAFPLKQSFGRNVMSDPCTAEIPCKGDFDFDHDCDGTDVARFKEDFGRSQLQNPCPQCVVVEWCNDSFRACGDIYPQDCLGESCADSDCGDGVIDMFDFLEMDDIIQGLQTATACQIGKWDVPNGAPPNCGNPSGTPNCESDGDTDIFDTLVIIDKAAGRENCCDYCSCDQVY